MGLMQYSLAFIAIAAFTLALMGFATNFAIDNNAAMSIADDPQITNLNTQVTSNLSGFREGSESTYQSIVESSIDSGETTVSGGQFAITPPYAIAIGKNILEVGYVKIFGTGSGFGIFLGTLVTTFGFILILLVWKAWAGRMPD